MILLPSPIRKRMKGGQETLFVKNLENVQGDERDVIFISTTYGSDARGNQFQRFGRSMVRAVTAA